MSFKPEQIVIPSRECQEIPIGMIGPIPVGLERDKDGVLTVDTPDASVKVSEETPQSVIKVIDQLFSYIRRRHPDSLNPTDVKQ